MTTAQVPRTKESTSLLTAFPATCKGYVLLFDFSNYFANAQHWPVSRELAKRVHDVRIRALANECLDNFGPIGYGLGSQISQTAALMLPNKLDHFIK